MNNESIIIRKVNENDAYNWFLLVNKVWRYAYKDIFPEEVFIDRDNKIEQKVKTFSETMKNDNKNIAYVADGPCRRKPCSHTGIQKSSNLYKR